MEDYDEDEVPLMIEDDVHSLEATNDREKVVDIFKLLSEKVFAHLKEDCETNHRYARRMIISNQNSTKPSQSHGSTPIRSPKRRAKREEILVVLPVEATSWNDLDEEDIFLNLLLTVEPIEVTWLNVRIHVDQFISEESKSIVEVEQDSEDDDEDSIETKVKKETDKNNSYLPQEDPDLYGECAVCLESLANRPFSLVECDHILHDDCLELCGKRLPAPNGYHLLCPICNKIARR